MTSGSFLEAGKAEGKSAVSESGPPKAAPKGRKRKSAEASKNIRAARDTSKPITVKKRRRPSPIRAVGNEIRGPQIDNAGRVGPDADSSIAVPGVLAPAVASGEEISWPIAR